MLAANINDFTVIHIVECRVACCTDLVLQGGRENDLTKAAIKCVTGCTSQLAAGRQAVVDYRQQKTGTQPLILDEYIF